MENCLPASSSTSENDDAIEGAAIRNGASSTVSGAWFAVAAVLAIAWFPYAAANVLYWLFTDDSANWPYLANTIWEIVQNLTILVVVLFIMYCDGRPWPTFGVVQPRWAADPVVAIAILVGTWGMLSVIYGAVGVVVGNEAVDQFSASAYEFAMPATAADYLALVLVSLCIGMSEELAMRGYLIPTFERLLKSTPLSVVLTSFIFASYHTYQGFGAAVWIFVLGLLFGAVFCWQRRLWPLVIAHAAMDVIGLSQEW